MNPSTKRRQDYSRRLKAEIHRIVGYICQQCKSTEQIQFDHIHGRNWSPNRIHYTKRLRIYLSEAQSGDLQALCATCNASKGKPISEPWDTTE